MDFAAERSALEAKAKTVLVPVLKTILRNEDLPVSGIKSALQSRLIKEIQVKATQQDRPSLERLRYMLSHGGQNPPQQTSTRIAAPAPPQQSVASQSYYSQPSQYNTMTPNRSPYPIRLVFKKSPFYEPVEALTPTTEMTRKIHDLRSDSQISPNQTAAEQHRASRVLHPTLTTAQADQMRANSNLRVMLYCAAEPIHQQNLDITFPQQVEVKVKNQEVKGNFKGLKNKPGTTRPTDITEYLRLLAQYRNEVIVTYALTNKVRYQKSHSPYFFGFLLTSIENESLTFNQQKFHVVAMLVRKHTVDELIERVKKHQVIGKQRVLSEMIAKANDPDVVAMSTVMSLKDPISTLRISIPCRSTVCSHNQCFDAESFLQLQEQAPTWTCPICNKGVTFDNLCVDQYVEEILAATPRSIDQVTIEPDGKWSSNSSVNGTPGSSSRPNGNRQPASYDDDDSDDLIEISDVRDRVSILKTEHSATPMSAVRTPPMPSREPSTAASSGHRPPKRKSEVIDLTLSDDDDEPVRPAKRQAYSTPGPVHNSYHHSNLAPSRTPSTSNVSHGMSAANPYIIGQSHPAPSSHYGRSQHQYHNLPSEQLSNLRALANGEQ
ncbi:hypothetical protein K402DRAFT_220163 [Aulographum hederae CBS 113979]|uniref:Uncharacterized protein n=1 Tax=Aulographum hederae CBS 113979 TaxID=1176131 RepID=A0A6G1GLG8_9PEZI|nr:hypothetical protein K402DRAFT_220163 [Aulographum hederae CBS 113979]